MIATVIALWDGTDPTSYQGLRALVNGEMHLFVMGDIKKDLETLHQAARWEGFSPIYADSLRRFLAASETHMPVWAYAH